tara:strand:- start:222 stop:533 length:312 start_codon:yes stop_codon:yes gene_type:complete
MLSDIKESVGKDQDVQVSVVGQLHNDRGFKIRVTDLDKCDGHMTKKWKQVCRDHGYNAHVSLFLNEGYASIVCEKCSFVERHLNKAIGLVMVIIIIRCMFLVQ